MFERVKGYRNLKKAEDFARGARMMGELIQDEKMVQHADETIKNIDVLKKKMWLSRKTAKQYNLAVSRHGYM